MKKIAVIGSTGSVGENTLRVVRAHPGKFQIVALAAKQNAEKLYEQAKEFRPKLVCLYDSDNVRKLEARLKPLKIKVVVGMDGLIETSTQSEVEQIIFSIVGAVGLRPIFAAVKAGKNVAVANKEPLVMAGEILMREVRKRKVSLLPIDSEHSGLWQCLEGRNKKDLSRLVLTSSGGPFLYRKGSLTWVKPTDALRHPKWKMGPKISIDSATLMNKGLEVIEASNLFDVPVHKIDVVIHPEAVIHALIEMVDGSYIAQLGITDMRLPIQYALGYPTRLENTLPRLDLEKERSLQFMKPDTKRFPCLVLGYEAKKNGGTMPAVLNAANETAVRSFLNGNISFTEIPKIIEKTMSLNKTRGNATLETVLEADEWARKEADVLCRS